MSEKSKNEKELEGLYARLGDMVGQAVRGELAVSVFLSPRELHYGELYLKNTGVEYFTFGGYNGSERKRIYILPDYMEGTDSGWKLRAFGFDLKINMLKIQGSGFNKLTHRDFMGALLGLGLQRSVVGDIVTSDDSCAFVFCDVAIADFLIENLHKVGRDGVRLSGCELDEGFSANRKYVPFGDTVASPRLDAVVAAVCSVSRDKAKELILAELVELDYECEGRPDREVKGGSLISIRGYGKFRILSIDEKTKKGRYRLLGEKFL